MMHELIMSPEGIRKLAEIILTPLRNITVKIKEGREFIEGKGYTDVKHVSRAYYTAQDKDNHTCMIVCFDGKMSVIDFKKDLRAEVKDLPIHDRDLPGRG